MKKILAIAAAAALSCGISAFAANPFSDVTPDDWAYQAVSDLSDQGVVEGYPDGTFKGERNITRYELAQIVARLMAKEDQLNGEQKATLDKLAGEYADELANLGVRVSNLEKKVGNLSWSGDARMRLNQKFKQDKNGGKKKVWDGKAGDSWDGRMRIKAKAQVNDSTTVTGLIRTDMKFKGGDSDTYMQQLFVEHKFGDKTKLTVGKYKETFGQTGILYDSEIKGAKLAYGAKDLKLTAGYARFDDWDAKAIKSLNDYKNDDDWTKKEVAYFRLGGAAGNLAYDAEYVTASAMDYDVWGVGLNYAFADKFNVFGDFYQNTAAKGDPELWSAGLSYGKQNWKKPGTFSLSAQYVSSENGTYMGGTTFDGDAQDIAFKDLDSKKVTFWVAKADITLQKNVGLHAAYAFDVEGKNKDSQLNYDDLWNVTLNYKF